MGFRLVKRFGLEGFRAQGTRETGLVGPFGYRTCRVQGLGATHPGGIHISPCKKRALENTSWVGWVPWPWGIAFASGL